MAKRLDRLEQFLASTPQASKGPVQTTKETFIHPNQLPSLEKDEKASKSNA
ncbi:hypothetical protein [Brevibacillus sp. SYSU BS000544]|uniref:hypothetical protein n=1 Tax=Brevibacillus sp. SYSU BS000544 TaxID=3416443 RepID=UPI003CE5A18A